jgi:hypothetical protein
MCLILNAYGCGSTEYRTCDANDVASKTSARHLLESFRNQPVTDLHVLVSTADVIIEQRGLSFFGHIAQLYHNMAPVLKLLCPAKGYHASWLRQPHDQGQLRGGGPVPCYRQ